MGDHDAGVAMAADLAGDVASAAARHFGLPSTAVEDRFGTVTLSVPVASWLPAARYVWGEGFAVLDWVTGVDCAPVQVIAMVVRHPTDDRSLARLLLRTALLPGTSPAGMSSAAGDLASLTALWPSAAWHERETAEMFGVTFADFTEPTPYGVVDRPRPLLTAGWPQPPVVPPLLRAATLPARAAQPWPGLREPVEPPELPADAHRRRASGRRPLPPGVPG